MVVHKMHCKNTKHLGCAIMLQKNLNQWFLNASTFGRPNKVLLLSPRNTQLLPVMVASTLLRLLKSRLPSLHEHLGSITQIFPHHDVDMWGRVWMEGRKVWTSLNFYKEYLFGFETLVFATLGISSMHEQLVTLQRERKTWNRIIWSL